jgi:hypothetical protein
LEAFEMQDQSCVVALIIAGTLLIGSVIAYAKGDIFID